MIFNSFAFFLFFLLFFVLYWFVFNKTLRAQNLFLLTASYIFYGWTDWRLLFILISVTALNYFLGIYIERTLNPTYKKIFLYIGLIQGIGGLAFFKYFNFFILNINKALLSLNIHSDMRILNLIIPLGISFFTFRIISYLLDIDKGKITATKDWVVFFNYVSFFPSILSGPIDKAKTFIPQLEKERVFNYSLAADGLRQILWGLFKKVVIADNCAVITNQLFAHYQDYHASTLLLGAFLYTIQIYTDFSGYSDMAIGFSRLMGFTITKNFDFPFFAQNIAEHWRKWHMSLTSWLTEYVFTPLSIALRDYNDFGLILAIVINFTICGIWHGANWTYLIFGFLHGCYFIPLILRGTLNKKKKIAKDKLLPSFRELFNVISTFSLVMLTFIIFRSETISKAVDYYKALFSKSLFSLPEFRPTYLLITIFCFFLVEWLLREKNYGLDFDRTKITKPIRISIYLFICYCILFNYRFHQQADFIYIQF
jgi:alginate O-acetyltransferase complex protein AlgI